MTAFFNVWRITYQVVYSVVLLPTMMAVAVVRFATNLVRLASFGGLHCPEGLKH